MPHDPSINQDTAREELGRYLSLRITGAPMFSGYIDDVWHGMQEHRGEYAAFSREHWGELVEHHPFEPGDVVYNEIPWVIDYEKKFGDLPVVWFARADGSIDEELRDHYRRTGKVERTPPRTGALMTCDCRPAKVNPR